MLNLVIFGGPGSGKGTQSDRLVDTFGLHHISTGELLRDHIARGTELGKVADSFISKGQLIPDELMIRVLEHHLQQLPEEKKQAGVIFDGFPRTLQQAHALDELLKDHDQKIDAVIGLEVDDEELVRRMLQRGVETGRADDNIDTIRKRIDVYHQTTSPLRDFYKDSGRYMPIDGNDTVEAIAGSIADKLTDKGHTRCSKSAEA